VPPLIGEKMSMKSAATTEEVPAVTTSARPHLNRAAVVLSFLSIYLIWGSTYLAATPSKPFHRSTPQASAT
jgi:hypothetical protein